MRLWDWFIIVPPPALGPRGVTSTVTLECYGSQRYEYITIKSARTSQIETSCQRSSRESHTSITIMDHNVMSTSPSNPLVHHRSRRHVNDHRAKAIQASQVSVFYCVRVCTSRYGSQRYEYITIKSARTSQIETSRQRSSRESHTSITIMDHNVMSTSPSNPLVHHRSRRHVNDHRAKAIQASQVSVFYCVRVCTSRYGSQRYEYITIKSARTSQIETSCQRSSRESHTSITIMDHNVMSTSPSNPLVHHRSRRHVNDHRAKAIQASQVSVFTASAYGSQRYEYITIKSARTSQIETSCQRSSRESHTSITIMDHNVMSTSPSNPLVHHRSRRHVNDHRAKAIQASQVSVFYCVRVCTSRYGSQRYEYITIKSARTSQIETSCQRSSRESHTSITIMDHNVMSTSPSNPLVHHRSRRHVNDHRAKAIQASQVSVFTASAYGSQRYEYITIKSARTSQIETSCQRSSRESHTSITIMDHNVMSTSPSNPLVHHRSRRHVNDHRAKAIQASQVSVFTASAYGSQRYEYITIKSARTSQIETSCQRSSRESHTSITIMDHNVMSTSPSNPLVHHRSRRHVNDHRAKAIQASQVSVFTASAYGSQRYEYITIKSARTSQIETSCQRSSRESHTSITIMDHNVMSTSPSNPLVHHRSRRHVNDHRAKAIQASQVSVFYCVRVCTSRYGSQRYEYITIKSARTSQIETSCQRSSRESHTSITIMDHNVMSTSPSNPLVHHRSRRHVNDHRAKAIQASQVTASAYGSQRYEYITIKSARTSQIETSCQRSSRESHTSITIMDHNVMSTSPSNPLVHHRSRRHVNDHRAKAIQASQVSVFYCVRVCTSRYGSQRYEYITIKSARTSQIETSCQRSSRESHTSITIMDHNVMSTSPSNPLVHHRSRRHVNDHRAKAIQASQVSVFYCVRVCTSRYGSQRYEYHHQIRSYITDRDVTSTIIKHTNLLMCYSICYSYGSQRYEYITIKSARTSQIETSCQRSSRESHTSITIMDHNVMSTSPSNRYHHRSRRHVNDHRAKAIQASQVSVFTASAYGSQRYDHHQTRTSQIETSRQRSSRESHTSITIMDHNVMSTSPSNPLVHHRSRRHVNDHRAKAIQASQVSVFYCVRVCTSRYGSQRYEYITIKSARTSQIETSCQRSSRESHTSITNLLMPFVISSTSNPLVHDHAIINNYGSQRYEYITIKSARTSQIETSCQRSSRESHTSITIMDHNVMRYHHQIRSYITDRDVMSTIIARKPYKHHNYGSQRYEYITIKSVHHRSRRHVNDHRAKAIQASQVSVFTASAYGSQRYEYITIKSASSSQIETSCQRSSRESHTSITIMDHNVMSTSPSNPLVHHRSRRHVNDLAKAIQASQVSVFTASAYGSQRYEYIKSARTSQIETSCQRSSRESHKHHNYGSQRYEYITIKSARTSQIETSCQRSSRESHTSITSECFTASAYGSQHEYITIKSARTSQIETSRQRSSRESHTSITIMDHNVMSTSPSIRSYITDRDVTSTIIARKPYKHHNYGSQRYEYITIKSARTSQIETSRQRSSRESHTSITIMDHNVMSTSPSNPLVH
ncbi:hypothetical protein EVAR_29565_1, partial [Eumeta japonica]